MVITLFVVALVTIIVLEYHYDAIVETELAANHANDAKAYYLAMSGLNFARAVLANDTNDYDASNELWHNLESFGCIAPSDLLTIAKTFIESQVKLGDDTPDEPAVEEGGQQACVALKIVDEDSKLPINHILDESEIETHWAGIAVQLLRALWTEEDSRDLPEDAVGAVMDWIDQGEGSTRGGGVSGEDDYYQTLESPYKTPGRKIEVPGELRLIRFFTCERLAKLFDGVTCDQIPNIDLGTNLYFSPFDFKRVNINTAHPALLMAMTNDNELCLEDIETQRNPLENQAQFLAEPFKSQADVGHLACLQDAVIDLPELQTKVRSRNAPDPEPYKPDDYLGTVSTYFRVESQAVIDGQINKKVVAVFHREAAGAARNQPNNQEDNQRGNQRSNQRIAAASAQANHGDRLKMVYFKIE